VILTFELNLGLDLKDVARAVAVIVGGDCDCWTVCCAIGREVYGS